MAVGFALWQQEQNQTYADSPAEEEEIINSAGRYKEGLPEYLPVFHLFEPYL